MVLTEHDIERLRKNGVVGRNGNRVKGNAAVLRYLSVGEKCDTITDLGYYKLKKSQSKRSKKLKRA